MLKHIAFVGVVLLAACANELSEEALKRESSTRKYQRLEKASGDYRGHLLVGKERKVPFQITVTTRWNAKGSDTVPEIQGAMRIGLFGGVQVASSSAYFDWGTGDLTIGFPKGTAGGTRLEFRAKIHKEAIDEATLEGPNQGRWNLELVKDGPSDFSDALDFPFLMKIESTRALTTEHQAGLWMKRLPVDVEAPPSSDLGFLPGLKTVVQLPYFARVPQDVLQTLYDPIAGTVHLRLGDYSRLEIDGVYLPLEKVRGTVFSGNTVKARTVMDPVERIALEQVADLPPERFKGVYQEGPDAVEYVSVAYLQYIGATVFNPVEYVFRSFPSLKLVYSLCKGRYTVERGTFNLEALEYLEGNALFSENKKRILDLRIGKDWGKLTGTIRSADSGGGADWPRLSLQPDPTLGPEGCREL